MALKKNLLANYIGQAWTAVLGLLFVLIFIKLLGIEAYGIIGLFAVLQVWLNLLDAGMSPTIVREAARSGESNPAEFRSLIRACEVIACIIALAVAVGIYFCSDLIAVTLLKSEQLDSASVSQAISLMGSICGLAFISSVYRSCLVGMQRQVRVNVQKTVIETIRQLGGICVLTLISNTIYAFFVWQLFVAGLNLLMLALSTYQVLPKCSKDWSFQLAPLRRILPFAAGMVGINLTSTILMHSDKVLLSAMLTLKEFGYYSIGVTIANNLSILVSPITQSWYPRIAQLDAKNLLVELTKTFHLGAQLLTVTVGSAAVVLIVLMEPFLRVWTQDEGIAENASQVARILVAGNLISGFLWMPYQLQLARGWTSLSITLNLVSICLVIPTLLWAIPRYGAIGAATVWLGLCSLNLIVGVHFIFLRVLPNEKRRWYIFDLAAPLSAAFALTGLVAWLLPESNNWELLAKLAVAAGLAITAASLAAPAIRNQAWQLVRTRTVNR